MGILDNIEHGLERAVNGAFAKTFRSSLQPLEISSALKAKMDADAQIYSRDRVLAPNAYTALVNPRDADRLDQLGGTLIEQLTDQVRRHAAKQGYELPGPPTVVLLPAPKTAVGMVEVRVGTLDSVRLGPVLEVGDRRVPLTEGTTLIGRTREADVVLTEGSVSKRHAQLTWDGATAELQDLGSTNGTFVDGARITRQRLTAPANLRFGAARARFRLVPRADADDAR